MSSRPNRRPTIGDEQIKIKIKIKIKITITITRRSPQQNCHAPRPAEPGMIKGQLSTLVGYT